MCSLNCILISLPFILEASRQWRFPCSFLLHIASRAHPHDATQDWNSRGQRNSDTTGSQARRSEPQMHGHIGLVWCYWNLAKRHLCCQWTWGAQGRRASQLGFPMSEESGLSRPNSYHHADWNDRSMRSAHAPRNVCSAFPKPRAGAGLQSTHTMLLMSLQHCQTPPLRGSLCPYY